MFAQHWETKLITCPRCSAVWIKQFCSYSGDVLQLPPNPWEVGRLSLSTRPCHPASSPGWCWSELTFKFRTVVPFWGALCSFRLSPKIQDCIEKSATAGTFTHRLHVNSFKVKLFQYLQSTIGNHYKHDSIRCHVYCNFFIWVRMLATSFSIN